MIFPLFPGSLLLVLLVSLIGFSAATRLGSPPQNPAPRRMKESHNYQSAGDAKFVDRRMKKKPANRQSARTARHATRLGSAPENPVPMKLPHSNQFAGRPNAQQGSQQTITRSSDSTFQLKLYWQLGYYWQEETFERKWCMECRHGCYDGGLVRIRECDHDEPDQDFEVVVGSGGDQIKVAGQELCLTLVDSHDIELQSCDSSDDHQLWVGFKAGGERFELSPKTRTGCVTNEYHHPKDKEFIWVDTCEHAREYTTSYWNTY